MNTDLKIIKKKYGENMAKLCRELFPSLLETKSLLSQLLLIKFEPNHALYQDIIEQGKKWEFKDYIYSLVDAENSNEIRVYKTPQEYLSEVGYDLYECKTEADIQSFKKYYAEGEELCTFNGGRLNQCYVFFAVRKDVAKIKREDFKFPNRQDEYGTSVISIQFTKDSTHTLSIKNRYNHRVDNPDATFSNNLDNIIEGLTESFAQEYGLIQQNKNENFELWGYVKANDGKYYKFNQEMYNIYYCPNNIIIDNFEVKRYEKEKYLIFDYFVLDLVNKKLELYDKKLGDLFSEVIGDILRIDIQNTEIGKEVTIISKAGKESKIILNQFNVMIIFKNSSIEEIGDAFLYNNKYLEELYLPNLKKVGDSFLFYNKRISILGLPNLEEIGKSFLFRNECFQLVFLPKLQIIGDDFCNNNDAFLKLDLPNLRKVGCDFLARNKSLKILNLPNLREIGDRFLYFNYGLQYLNLQNLEKVGDSFLIHNGTLRKLNLIKLQKAGDSFLYYNKTIRELNLPDLCTVGNDFLGSNTYLKELNLPSLIKVGHNFLERNDMIEKLNLPKLQVVGDSFLSHNNSLVKLDLSALEIVGNGFLMINHVLREVILINLCEIGIGFLSENDLLQTLYLPKLTKVDYGFLSKHPIFNRQNYEKKLQLSRKLEK